MLVFELHTYLAPSLLAHKIKLIPPLLLERYIDQDTADGGIFVDDAMCPLCSCCSACTVSCLACNVGEEGVVDRVCRLLSIPYDTDDTRWS